MIYICVKNLSDFNQLCSVTSRLNINRLLLILMPSLAIYNQSAVNSN